MTFCHKLKMEGFEGYLAAMSKTNPGAQGQNSDSMKDMFSSFSTDMMPDTPVKIGDTWPFETKMSIPNLGTMNTTLQYTFKDWDKIGDARCARIEFKGNITNIPDASATQQMMNMSIKEGTLSGKMWFDELTGLLIESVNDQVITMESKIKVPLPSGVREKTTTIKLIQNVNVKMVENNLSR
jgi:hypothetical protein